jgi:hypothetical protein
MLAGLVVFVILSIVVISENLEVIWPTKEILYNQKKNYRRLKTKLEEAEKLHTEFLKSENSATEKIKLFYTENDKVKADIYMRQRIEHAAKFSTLVLKSMSSVRKKAIKGETVSLDLSINVEGSFEKVIVFLQELNKNKAGFYWVNCYLRPAGGRNKEKFINLNGVIRMISTDGKLFDVKKKVKK